MIGDVCAWKDFSRLVRVSTLSSERWISGSPVTSSVIDFFGGLHSRDQTDLTRDSTCNLLELPVVRPATGGVDQAAGDTRYEELVGYLKLHDVIDLFLARLEHDVQFLRLGDRSRKTIKDETGVVHRSV